MIKLSTGEMFNETQIEKITPWRPAFGGSQARDEVPTLWDIHFVSGAKHTIGVEEKQELEGLLK